jgi:hypothetical protein
MHVRQVDVEQNKVGALRLNRADRCFPGVCLGNLEACLKQVLRLKVAKWLAVVTTRMRDLWVEAGVILIRSADLE